MADVINNIKIVEHLTMTGYVYMALCTLYRMIISMQVAVSLLFTNS